MLDTPFATSPDAVNQALERLGKERPHIKSILLALGGLLRVRSELAEQFSSESRLDPERVRVDPVRFAAGVPLSPRTELHFEPSVVKCSLDRMSAVMAVGLPAARPHVETVKAALADSALLVDLLGAVMAGQDVRLAPAARDMGVSLFVLQMVLEETARPMAIAHARRIAARVSEMKWDKGYCPVCGSPPEMRVITADGGRCLLSCSFCCHCWRYPRTPCPFCNGKGEEPPEFFFIEGREAERVEGCRTCNRYLPVFDIRQAASFTPDVAILGLLPLEMILQEKGFSRGTASWIVREAVSFKAFHRAEGDEDLVPH